MDDETKQGRPKKKIPNPRRYQTTTAVYQAWKRLVEKGELANASRDVLRRASVKWMLHMLQTARQHQVDSNTVLGNMRH